MKFELEQLEKKRENYAFKINELIKEFKNNPQNYNLLFKPQKNSQAVYVLDGNYNEVLFFEVQKNCFCIIFEPESGTEIIIETDSDAYEVGKRLINDVTISESYDYSNLEISIQAEVSINQSGQLECELYGGEIIKNAVDIDENYCIQFSNSEIYEDELEEDGEMEEYPEDEEDAEIEDYSEDEDGELLQQQFEKEETKDFEGFEGFEDYSEGDSNSFEFTITKNGKKNEISSDEFDRTVSRVLTITQEITSDFSARIEEMKEIKESIICIKEYYRKKIKEEKEK